MVKPSVIPRDVAKPDLKPYWPFFITKMKSGPGLIMAKNMMTIKDQYS